MRQSHDLLAMSALMLVAVLTVWLGIAGPIDLTKLKEWQPLIGACIAVGAAFIAYRAAMAKVDFDREIHLRTARQRNFGVYLRLDAALRVLRGGAGKWPQTN